MPKSGGLENVFLAKLQQEIGVKFHNTKLLKQALTHRSYLNEDHRAKEHNERLEFLGDAALEWIVTQYLFRQYSGENEGTLTNIRSKIVQGETLAKVAEKLNLAEYLCISRGGRSELENPRSRSKLMANTLEAIIGAIAVDRGLGTAELFVIEYLLPLCDEVVQKQAFHDPKTYLQELVQERRNGAPYYKLLKEDGPDHDKRFTVGCYVNGQELARGFGQSKSEAEKQAAGIVLREQFRVELPQIG